MVCIQKLKISIQVVIQVGTVGLNRFYRWKINNDFKILYHVARKKIMIYHFTGLQGQLIF